MSNPDDKEPLPPFMKNLLDKNAELRATLQSLRELAPIMIERAAITAEIQYAKYNALKAAGFTEAQALELCKHIYT